MTVKTIARGRFCNADLSGMCGHCAGNVIAADVAEQRLIFLVAEDLLRKSYPSF